MPVVQRESRTTRRVAWVERLCPISIAASRIPSLIPDIFSPTDVPSARRALLFHLALGTACGDAATADTVGTAASDSSGDTPLRPTTASTDATGDTPTTTPTGDTSTADPASSGGQLPRQHPALDPRGQRAASRPHRRPPREPHDHRHGVDHVLPKVVYRPPAPALRPRRRHGLWRFLLFGEQGEAIVRALPGPQAPLAEQADGAVEQLKTRGLVVVALERLRVEFR